MVKMFNRFGCNLALASMLLLTIPAAHAVSKIVITGNIKAAPCEIDGANGTVSFPPLFWRPPGPLALGWSSL